MQAGFAVLWQWFACRRHYLLTCEEAADLTPESRIATSSGLERWQNGIPVTSKIVNRAVPTLDAAGILLVEDMHMLWSACVMYGRPLAAN